MNDMLTPQSLFIEPPRRDRVTAISGAVQRRPIVFVLGMHRSGTSLCSHILSALGVDMVDDIGVNRGNERGHWERWEIVEFHDRILALFNRDYNGRFHDFALPVAWWADPRVAMIRREIVAFLEGRMGEGYFGFKDPRTVRLMPVWHQILRELKLEPKVVLCLRNPAQVARSLHARDGLDAAMGEYRWLVYMMDFFRFTHGLDFCVVDYEGWFDSPDTNIEKLQKFLDLPWPQSESDLALVLSDLIDRNLRHDGSAHRDPSLPLVRTLYKLASRPGQDVARDQISYIVSQFVSFQQLQKPFLRTFEEVAQVATVLQAAVETAEHRANASEARLADAENETTALRGLVAKAEQEAAERGIAAAAMEAEVETLRDALAQAEREGQEHAATAEAVQAEVMTLRDALSQAERVGREHAATAEAMQAEVMTLRDALAQAERVGREYAATAEATQAEVIALRDALSQAERVGREHTATAEAVQAEVMRLRDALAQAERDRHERAAAQEAMQREIGVLRRAVVQDAQERLAATTAMQAEITELRDALARAEGAAREGADASAAMQGEITELRDALARAEDAAREGADASAAMQGEIVNLREKLAQAAQEERVQAAAAGSAEAEISTLRTAVARAESAAQERGAAREAMQAEIASVRNQLAAAREVGRAALASLQTDLRAMPEATPSAGWLTPILRLIGLRTAGRPR